MGFGVWGLGFGVWGLGFGVWGLGFTFQGSALSAFRTSSFRVSVSTNSALAGGVGQGLLLAA